MNTPIDTLSHKAGDLLYYVGKFGNTPGWGTIKEVKQATHKAPLSYVVDMGEDYPDKFYQLITVPHYCLKPGVGQLFKTKQQFEQDRDEANNRLNEFFKSLNRKPLML